MERLSKKTNLRMVVEFLDGSLNIGNVSFNLCTTVSCHREPTTPLSIQPWLTAVCYLLCFVHPDCPIP